MFTISEMSSESTKAALISMFSKSESCAVGIETASEALPLDSVAPRPEALGELNLQHNHGSGLHSAPWSPSSMSGDHPATHPPNTRLDTQILPTGVEGKHSSNSKPEHRDQVKKCYDPLLSPDPDNIDDAHSQQSESTIKSRSVSYHSGLSTLTAGTESDREQTGSKQAAQNAKRMTHYRSMSDYGLPHKAILEDTNSEGKNSDSPNLSSSFPTNPKGELRDPI